MHFDTFPPVVVTPACVAGMVFIKWYHVDMGQKIVKRMEVIQEKTTVYIPPAKEQYSCR